MRDRTPADELACIEVVELITDYLEGTLPARERALFEAHLRECDGCGAYVDQMRATIELTGRVTADSLSAETRAGLLTAFADWRRSR